MTSGARGPKTAPRAPQESLKSRPEAVSERPGWPPGAHGLQEAIWAPSGVDFGHSGASCSKLPALLAEPSGEQAQTQAQAQARAQAQAQAQAQAHGPKAKDRRPQGLKDSKSRRDVRSTLIRRASRHEACEIPREAFKA